MEAEAETEAGTHPEGGAAGGGGGEAGGGGGDHAANHGDDDDDDINNGDEDYLGGEEEDDEEEASAAEAEAFAAPGEEASAAAAPRNRSRSSSRPRRPPHRLVEELNRRHGNDNGGNGDVNDVGRGGNNPNAGNRRRGRRGNGNGQRRRQPPRRTRAVLVENSVGDDNNGGQDDDEDDDEDDDAWEDLRLPDDAAWPEATPPPLGEGYMSVFCDGVGWAWTNYANAEANFHPSVLWRTSRLNPEIFQASPASTDPMFYLRPFLPAAVQEFFFGEADPEGYEPDSGPSVVSRHRAVRTAALRAVPVVNVYVIMDREDDLRAIAFLLSHMPVKIYRLRPADFLLPPLKCDPVLDEPSDRLAAVRGALAMTDNKVPAMVILAGPNVVSVTTVGVDFQVAGMGTSCGIAAKLRALEHREDGGGGAAAASSSVATNHSQLHALVKAVKERGVPINLFGGTAMEQHLGSALYEMGAYLTATVAKWKEDATKDLEESPRDPNAATNSDLTVVVCGLDSDIVEDMLKSGHANLLRPPVFGHPEAGVQTIVCKNLVSKGVQEVLVAQYAASIAACDASEEERARRATLGCRVAKRFGSRAYRGTVVAVAASEEAFDEDLYQVIYDDGDREDYYPFELYDHLQLYSETGEAWKERDESKHERLEAKKTQSREAAEFLDEFIDRAGPVAEAVPASPPPTVQLDAKFGEESEDVSHPADVAGAPGEDASSLKIPANVNVASNDVPSAASSIASATGAAAAAGRKRKQAPAPRGRGRPRLYPSIADLSQDPGGVVGRRIARYFDNPDAPGNAVLFFGSVSGFRVTGPDTDDIEDIEGSASVGMLLWDVVYEDGDEESLEAAQLISVLKLYQKNAKDDPALVPAGDFARAVSGRDEDAGSAAAEPSIDADMADAGAASHPGADDEEGDAAGAAPLELRIERDEEMEQMGTGRVWRLSYS